jgi:5-deoxy-glucuronate isomerase
MTIQFGERVDDAHAARTASLVFRGTNRLRGRNVAVSPKNSAMKHLAYGRIILDALHPAASFSTSNRETGLICLSGSASIKVGAEQITLGRYDSLYIPRGSSVEVKGTPTVDIAEFSADVEGQYPLQFVRYANVVGDPGLQFSTGCVGSSRQLSMLLTKNVEAGRLIAGFTVSEPGNWTSWPPHEHAAMLEEMYVYFDMPAPAYGLQLVYNDTKYPEFIAPVRDGDVVLMPNGYHPNVAVPGHQICFLWAMAAHRECDDRQFGVVNVQPDFNQGRSGLEAGRKK